MALPASVFFGSTIARDMANTAILEADFPALEALFAGSMVIDGTIEASLPSLQAIFEGLEVADGSFSAISSVLQASFSGIRISDGSISALLPALQADFSGIRIVDGSFAASFPALQSSMAGKKIFNTSFSANLPSLTASFSGGKYVAPPLLDIIGAEVSDFFYVGAWGRVKDHVGNVTYSVAQNGTLQGSGNCLLGSTVNKPFGGTYTAGGGYTSFATPSVHCTQIVSAVTTTIRITATNSGGSTQKTYTFP